VGYGSGSKPESELCYGPSLQESSLDSDHGCGIQTGLVLSYMGYGHETDSWPNLLRLELISSLMGHK
jgi:hypothetical protein